eukprot:5357736-Prymnesium_polylepis.2
MLRAPTSKLTSATPSDHASVAQVSALKSAAAPSTWTTGRIGEPSKAIARLHTQSVAQRKASLLWVPSIPIAANTGFASSNRNSVIERASRILSANGSSCSSASSRSVQWTSSASKVTGSDAM